MTTMQLEKQNTATAVRDDELRSIRMINGLRGFSEIRETELVYRDDERPFMWLRDKNPDGVQFLVAEPVYLFDHYKIEIFEDDAAELGLTRDDVDIVGQVTFVRLGVEDGFQRSSAGLDELRILQRERPHERDGRISRPDAAIVAPRVGIVLNAAGAEAALGDVAAQDVDRSLKRLIDDVHVTFALIAQPSEERVS